MAPDRRDDLPEHEDRLQQPAISVPSAYAAAAATPLVDRTAELARHAARRAAAASEGRPLDELLAELPSNDLTTLLLHAHRVRAHRRSFRDLRDAHDRLAMTRASSADARLLHAFDGAFFATAAAFDAVALAPVSPLGAAACAGIEPNHALATLRFAELAADPTSGLVLEAARRRRGGLASAPLRLCASQRVTRMQPLDNPAFSPHFQLAALATYRRSSSAAADDAVDRAMLVEHVQTWAAMLAPLRAAGFRIATLRVVFADVRLTRAALAAAGVDATRAATLARQATAHRAGSTEAVLSSAGIELRRDVPAAELRATVTALALPRPIQALAAALVDELAAPLAAACPEVGVAFDLARIQALSYYSGPCLQLHLRRDDGLELSLGDGGALSWLATLLDDRRQRMVTTGVGAELLVKLYQASAQASAATPPG